MFKNYFKTAWRNLSKHRAYNVINILGLTLGMTSCLVIFLVVQYELGYDKFNSKSDRIYRVTLNGIGFNPCISMAVAEPLRHDFPELEAVTQAQFHQSGLITIGQNKYEEKGLLYADKYFPQVFDYKWIEGNTKTALAEPNSIVLTESLAKKYFSNKNAMGQIINLENNYNLKVTGVIKDVPGNTHLNFKYLVSLETIRKDNEEIFSSFWAIPEGSFTYILTSSHYDISKIQNRIKGFLEKNWGKDIAKDTRLPLQPLTDIHFDARYLNNTISYTTSRETYYALTAVALLIIIIACINFINLATAQAIKRAKEVGVRKVLGSSRSQLVTQFLGETSLIVFSALILASILIVLLLPQLSAWLDIRISVTQLTQPSVISLILISVLIIVLLAGLYPAFVQSAFRPSESLKSKGSLSSGKLTLRKSLVVFQFAISQAMIIGTLVVAYQMNFFENQNLGFNKDAVISLNIPDENKDVVLKQQLLSNPGIKDVCFSSAAPVYNSYFTALGSDEPGISVSDVSEIKFIDEHYIDMFQLQMLGGEKIQRTHSTEDDTVYNVVVNETMIHKLGVQDPQRALGKHIKLNGNWHCTITGVLKDFQSESKHKAIRPCALMYRADNFSTASVKLASANMNKTIADINRSWSSLFPQNVFSYEFLDDHIAAWYKQEQKEYTAFRMFAGIAILIGCLGLYGLVAFAAAQRTKEVGIRKVLGASITNIIILFSKEFVSLIAIAFAIAAPITYYFMNDWLQGFAYQIKIGANIFVIAILSSVVIAACTIAYEAIKAAVANPLKSLRTE